MPVSMPDTKAASVAFFIMHYGLFTVVHSAFVFAIVLGLYAFVGVGPPPPIEATNFGTLALMWLLGSLVYLLVTLRTPKEALPTVQTLMTSPYRRIVVLHVTILVGISLITWFDWPPAAAVLLVVLHAVSDLMGRNRRAKAGDH